MKKYIIVCFTILVDRMTTDQNTNIIKNYKKFFTFVSTYFFLLIAVIVAFFLFQKIFIGATNTINTEDPFYLQKIKLVGMFNKFLDHTVVDNDLQIYILQWPLLIQNNFFVSQDNLVTYKGFVVPRNLAIATTLPIRHISYFDQPNYASGELSQFVNNFVLTTQDNSSNTIKNNQIPLNGSIISTFNLSCVSESVIYGKTCAHFFENFLNSFFVYDLTDDYGWLQKVFSSIRNEKQHVRFCDGMKKYLLYTNDTNKELSQIFESCGSGYNDFYKRMWFFVDIQNQLQDKYISPDVYKDHLLNVYKLLSYQQILYQDFQDLNIRKNQYTLYFAYVQEVIKRKGLPQFYLDELYWYNTYYLKPTLLSARYDRRRLSIKEWEIMQVVKSIDTINMGDNFSTSSGLELLVSNTGLVQNAHILAPGEILTLQEQIAKKIATLTYFTIAQSAITSGIVDAQWYFLVNGQKIYSKVQLSFSNDSFLVTYIDIPEYTELSSALQWLINMRDTSIGEFFVALTKNLPLYQHTTPVKDLLSMCNDIRTLESGLDMQVSTCTQDVLVLNKTINGISVMYTFLLQNALPIHITVSDDTLQTAVLDTVKQSGYTPNSLSEAVQFILSIVPISTTVHLWSTNTLLTLQDFQKILGIDANDIAEKNGVILVDFTINGVNFIANYDISKHTIAALYFKDIISNWQPLLIKNLSLVLEEKNQETIDSFVKDPLTYIQKIDLSARKNYTDK